MSEKCNAFLRPLKNKGFKEERVTTMRLDDLGKSTTLESNKSLANYVDNNSDPTIASNLLETNAVLS